MARVRTAIFDRSVDFLASLGVTVSVVPGTHGFIPHVALRKGCRIDVDRRSDAAVPDLLHEAGHLVTVPSLFRPHVAMDANGVAGMMSRYLDEHPGAFCGPEEDLVARGILQCGECEAIAWSYAAAKHLGANLNQMFKIGFDGEGRALFLRLEAGQHLGIHGLAAAKMTDLPRPILKPEFPFPMMRRWVQI